MTFPIKIRRIVRSKSDNQVTINDLGITLSKKNAQFDLLTPISSSGSNLRTLNQCAQSKDLDSLLNSGKIEIEMETGQIIDQEAVQTYARTTYKKLLWEPEQKQIIQQTTQTTINVKSPLHKDNSGNVTIDKASGSQDGYISKDDWNSFNNKQNEITGAATTITDSDLTSDKVLVSDSSGKVSVGSITVNELDSLSGIRDNVQDQLDALESSITGYSGGGDTYYYNIFYGYDTYNLYYGYGYGGTEYDFSTGLTLSDLIVTANLSTGYSGGQELFGGTGPGENLNIESTLDSTKGHVYFGYHSVFDQYYGYWGFNTLSPEYTIDANGNIRLNGQLISTIEYGYAPFIVSSYSWVENLNADLLDGYHAADFSYFDHVHNFLQLTDTPDIYTEYDSSYGYVFPRINASRDGLEFYDAEDHFSIHGHTHGSITGLNPDEIVFGNSINETGQTSNLKWFEMSNCMYVNGYVGIGESPNASYKLYVSDNTNSGIAIFGINFGTSGSKYGIYGEAMNAGTNYGVYGLASGGTDYGVYGVGTTAGYFLGNVNVSGTLTIGTLATGTASTILIHESNIVKTRDLSTVLLPNGTSYQTLAYNSGWTANSVLQVDTTGAVVGIGIAPTDLYKLYVSNSTETYSIYGTNTYGTGSIYSIFGISNSSATTKFGVYGQSVGSNTNYGVYGLASGGTNYGVYGQGSTYGVYGVGTTAGYFLGTVNVSGTLTVGTLATDTTDTVIIHNAGILKTRTIDSRVWATSSLVDVSGTPSQYQVAYWNDANTLISSANLTFSGSILTVTGSASVTNSGDGGTALYGLTTGTGTKYGVYGQSINATTNTGVYGLSSGGTTNYGVYGQGSTYGVYGVGTTAGYFLGNAVVSGTLTVGTLDTSSTSNDVIVHESNILKTRTIDSRVWGSTLVDYSGSNLNTQIAYFTDTDTITSSSGLTWGSSILTVAGSISVTNSSASGTAIFGISTGSGTKYGVYGESMNAGTNYGVYGLASGGTNYGVYGQGSTYGVYGVGTTAGYFLGNVNISGTLTVGTLATGATDTVITHSSNILQTRTIDPKVWGLKLTDYTGTLSQYEIAYWNDADTLTGDSGFTWNTSTLYVNGYVGIGIAGNSLYQMYISDNTTNGTALYAISHGTGTKYGIYGQAINATTNTGVYGLASGGTTNYGVYGIAASGTAYAGYFVGNVYISGTISGATWGGGIIDLAHGGTNANLTADAGGIVFSSATALSILAPETVTTTASQVLMNRTTTPNWSTATYPAVATGTGKILRADGTNWVETTATYPATAGTAGKILISDGTNIVSSTPTYPNSASGTGTILRADGTNWVSTTATYPNATTANYILYSTSANVIGESANLTFNGSTLTVSGAVSVTNNSASGTAIFGISTGSGTKFGVYGESMNATTNYGVYGLGFGGTTNYGVYGQGSTYGVYGVGTTAGYFLGNVNVSGTLTVGTLAADTTDTVVIHNAGILKTRTIDSRVWATSSLVDVSGTPSQYQVAYFNDANTLVGDSDFQFDGSTVGIGTSPNSSYQLYINETTTNGIGLYVISHGTGTKYGIYGQSINATTNTGVYGLASGGTTNYGVYGIAANGTAYAGYFLGNVTTIGTIAGTTIVGANVTSGTDPGHTHTTIPSGSNDYIQNQVATEQSAGFRINSNGIFNGGNVVIGSGSVDATKQLYVIEVNNDSAAIFGLAQTGTGTKYGVYGQSLGGTTNYGIYGLSSGGTNNYGVYGQGSTYGVYGVGTTAGYFLGNAVVSGTLTIGTLATGTASTIIIHEGNILKTRDLSTALLPGGTSYQTLAYNSGWTANSVLTVDTTGAVVGIGIAPTDLYKLYVSNSTETYSIYGTNTYGTGSIYSVFGISNSNATNKFGVYGQSIGPNINYGIYGSVSEGASLSYGGYFINSSVESGSTQYGSYMVCNGLGPDYNVGVRGLASNGNYNYGVWGYVSGPTGSGRAGYFSNSQSTSGSTQYAVFAYLNGTGPSVGYGVYSFAANPNATINYGIYGLSSGGTTNYGVYGQGSTYGVYGAGTTYGGYFLGNVYIGSLATGATDTVITHSSNILQTRTIDPKVWNNALVDYTGTMADNYVAHWSDTDTLTGDSGFTWNGSALYVNGYVGVGVAGNSSYQLYINETTTNGIGLYSISHGTGTKYGIYGQSMNATTNTGVYGLASGGTTNYGVYGIASSGTAYAGYFLGNVTTIGTITGTTIVGANVTSGTDPGHTHTTIPSGSNDYIQNQVATEQSAGFRINSNGIFNGGNVVIGSGSVDATKQLYVIEVNNDSAAIFGLAQTGTGTKYGVYGQSIGGTTNYGIYGLSSGGTNNYGVYGQGSTYGVYGVGTTAGYFLGNAVVSGTLTVGTLATGATDTVITHIGNILQTRTIDPKVWGLKLTDYTGTLSQYEIAYWNDADTLTGDSGFTWNTSTLYVNGYVGIGVAGNASYQLYISEATADSSAVYTTNIGTGTTTYSLFGLSNSTATNKYGVYGQAAGTGTNSYGVYGIAGGASNSYGVFGSGGTTNYAGYFDGKVVLNSSLEFRNGVYFSHFKDVAFYQSWDASVPGTLKITLPVLWTSNYIMMTIKGYNYSWTGDNVWEVVLGGYNYSSSAPYWYNCSATTKGTPAPFDKVRFCDDGVNACILLGTTSTVWYYPKVVITDVIVTNNLSVSSFRTGYSLTFITDEASITSRREPPLTLYGRISTNDAQSVYASNTATGGTSAYALFGLTNSTASTTKVGVYGQALGVNGTNYGIYGLSSGGTTNIGVYGQGSTYGVYGTGTTAGYFLGNAVVSGTLTVGTLATGTASTIIIHEGNILKTRDLSTSLLPGGTDNQTLAYNSGWVANDVLQVDVDNSLVSIGITPTDTYKLYVSNSTEVYSIYGTNTYGTGSIYSVFGISDSNATIKYGVYGQAVGTGTNSYGVFGWASGGTTNYGVYGTGTNYGVYGQSPGYAGYFLGNVNISGTLTVSTLTTSSTSNDVIVHESNILKTRTIDSRVWGSTLVDYSGSNLNTQIAYFTDADTITSSSGLTWATNTLTVAGAVSVTNNSASGTAIFGISTGSGTKYGVYGESMNATTNYGVYGLGFGGTTNTGVYGQGSTCGVYGAGTTYGGYFLGNVYIGSLATGATDTVITHSGNILQTRTIDPKVWGTLLVDYTGTMADNYVAHWSDTDTLTGDSGFTWNGSALYVNGYVGVGVAGNSSYQLYISQNSKSYNIYSVNSYNTGSVYSIFGLSNATSGTKYGVYGQSSGAGTANLGVKGAASGGTVNYGVVGEAGGTLGTGSYAGYFFNTIILASSSQYGVYSSSTGAGGGAGSVNYGVYGLASGAIVNYGVYGVGTTAGYFLGNTYVSGTLTVGTLAADTTDTVVIHNAGILKTRTIDSRVWGSSSLVDVSGTPSQYQVAYWNDANTLVGDTGFTWNTSALYVNGYVGVGIAGNSSYQLYINETTTNGIGLYSISHGTGTKYGIYGQSINATTNTGVYGLASGGTTNYGIYGIASSGTAWAGYFVGHIGGYSTSTGNRTFYVDNTNDITYFRGKNTVCTFGDELVTNGTFTSDLSGWTVGANWAYSSGVALHTTGSTETLSQDFSVTTNTYYYIEFTTASRTTGSISVDLGGFYFYHIGDTSTYDANSTFRRTIYYTGSTGTSTLTITPTSTFNGSIDNVSLKAYSSAAQYMLTTMDSQGSTVHQMRGHTANAGVTEMYSMGIGYYALEKMSYAAIANVALGTYALRNCISGVGNTSVGYNSLVNNYSGIGNTAVGYSALAVNKSGYLNVAVGYSAGYGIQTGMRNIAIGYISLYQYDVGDYNIAIGSNTMQNASGVSYDIAIGSNALGNDSGAGYNIAIGPTSGYGVSTGTYNVLIGYESGRDITTGDFNITIGYRAGYELNGDDGNNNVIVGSYAGYGTATTSVYSDCVFVGYNAGYSDTTGIRNTFIGNGAGYTTSTQSFNVFVGYNSGYSSAAEGNTGLGYAALQRKGAGGANVAVGTAALYGAAGSTFANNVGVGYYSGVALTTGSNNTLIGYQAGNSLTDGHDNIIIGYDIDASGASGDYELNIGNTIYGDLSIGNVSIGTSTVSSSYKLYVSNSTNDSKSIFGISYGTSGSKFGIYGEAMNPGTNYGVYGLATGGTTNIGVYGIAANGTAYAGYFIGNVYVSGTISGATWGGGIIDLAHGGTNANLIANNGGIVYSSASALGILAGTATAGQILRSGASTTPAWSTATYPAIAGTSGKILISDGTNIVSSTPTYPNSASGTGTILRADGTNWVATTATYPTTTSANYILYSTSANVIGESANLTFDGSTFALTGDATVSNSLNKSIINSVYSLSSSTATSWWKIAEFTVAYDDSGVKEIMVIEAELGTWNSARDHSVRIELFQRGGLYYTYTSTIPVNTTDMDKRIIEVYYDSGTKKHAVYVKHTTGSYSAGIINVYGSYYTSVYGTVSWSETTPTGTLVFDTYNSPATFSITSVVAQTGGMTTSSGTVIIGSNAYPTTTSKLYVSNTEKSITINAINTYGTGTNYGVYSLSNSSATTKYGIYGQAAGTGNNYGIYGLATGGTNNYGVYGCATVASNSYAGYFLGNVFVSGTLTVDTLTTNTTSNTVIVSNADVLEARTIDARAWSTLLVDRASASTTANQITYWDGTDGTLTSSANLTFSGSALTVTGTATITSDVTIDTNTFFVDASQDNIGIGTSSPTATKKVDLTSSLEYGLYSYNTSAGGKAIFGISIGTGTKYGVYGASINATTNTGVYGLATGTGTNYGVYGVATGGTNNYGGYFEGDVHIKYIDQSSITVNSIGTYFDSNATNIVPTPSEYPTSGWEIQHTGSSTGTLAFTTDGLIPKMKITSVVYDSNRPILIGTDLGTITGLMTVSFEAFSDVESAVLRVALGAGGTVRHTYDFSLSTNWKKYSYSVTSAYNIDKIYFYLRTNAGEYDIRRIQLESGSQATGFYPQGTRSSGDIVVENNINIFYYGSLAIGTTSPVGKIHVEDSTSSYGIYSNNTYTTSPIYGIFGLANATINTNSFKYGVYGQAAGAGTTSTNIGVYGIAAGGTTANYGVYGQAVDGTAYAGYFVGNVSGVGGETSISNFKIIFGRTADSLLHVAAGTDYKGNLYLNYEGGIVSAYQGSDAGITSDFKIYGYRTADALRSLEIGVGVDAADTASFDGLSNYYFDGNMGVGVLPNSSYQLYVKETGADTASIFAINIGSGTSKYGIYGEAMNAATTNTGVYGLASGGTVNVGVYGIAANGTAFAGYFVGRVSIIDGLSNVYLGHQTTYALTTGSNNIAIGVETLRSVSSGTYNIAIGNNAGYTLTTTSGNVFIGQEVGYSNTGEYNVGIGYKSIKRKIAGNYNVAVGTLALYGADSSAFSNNTAMGYYSGVALTTGSNNTLIGYQAGNSLTDGHDNIIIGYDVDASSASGDYELNIGNTIYGDLASATVGINTSVNSNYQLYVYDSLRTYGAYVNNVYTGAVNSYAIFGINQGGGSVDRIGVGGQSVYYGATTSRNYGIYGIVSLGATNYGVYGSVFGATGAGYAGYFQNISTTTNSTQYGVFAITNASISSNSFKYGVYGQGAGAGTTSTNLGVYGIATGGTTANYGVYGVASGTGAWAGYFVGDVAAYSPVNGYRTFYVDNTNNVTYFRGNNTLATVSSTNLVTNGTFTTTLTGWTVSGTGTGWTCVSDKAKHGAGNTETLSQSISVTTNTYYVINITVSGRTVSYFTLALGANAVVPVDSVSGGGYDANVTYQVSVYYTGATGSANLTFTPTSTFDGSVDDVSVYEITSTAAYIATFIDSENNSVHQMRGHTGSGVYSIGIGYRTLENNTSDGLGNAAFGPLTLLKNINGDHNIAIGLSALQENLSGNANVAIGSYSLDANTGGANNISIGVYSGTSITVGSRNVLVGSGAGDSITTGYDNIAIGYYALPTISTHALNVAIGYSSFYTNAQNYNTGIGGYTGYFNSSGANNCYCGYAAGYRNATGSNNTYVGFESGYGVSSQNNSENTGVGSYSLFGITTGGYNTGIGFKSLYRVTSGTYNIAIGHESGYSNSDATGVLTGIGNILIGYRAGKVLDDGDYNIIIGYDTNASASDANNELNIGNTIYGNLSVGNVSIGTSTVDSSYQLYVDNPLNNRITNGTFTGTFASGDMTGWASTAWTGTNQAIIASTSTDVLTGTLVPAPEAGKRYSVTYTIVSNTGAKTLTVAIGGTAGTARTGAGTYTEVITATNTTQLKFTPNATSSTITIDNVIVYDVDNYGIYSSANLDLSSATNYGIFGISNSAATTKYGVYGQAAGTGTNVGVYGLATGGTTNYGIFGYATGATYNFDGYFGGSGDVYVKNKFVVDDNAPTGITYASSTFYVDPADNKVGICKIPTTYELEILGSVLFEKRIIFTPVTMGSISGSSYDIGTAKNTLYRLPTGTNDLTKISNGVDGQVIILKGSSSGTITIKDVAVSGIGAGGFQLAGGAQIALANYGTAMFVYDGTYWLELSRSVS